MTDALERPRCKLMLGCVRDDGHRPAHHRSPHCFVHGYECLGDAALSHTVRHPKKTEPTTMHARLTEAFRTFGYLAPEAEGWADAILATPSMQGVETLEARAAKYSDDNTRLAQLLNKMEDQRDAAVEMLHNARKTN